MGYAATGDEDLLQRVNHMVDVMIQAQDVMGDGLYSNNDAPTWGFYKMAKEKVITPYGWDENGHPWGNNNIGFPFYAHHKRLPHSGTLIFMQAMKMPEWLL